MTLTNKQRKAIIELINDRILIIEKDPVLNQVEKLTFKESYQSLIKQIETDISAEEILQDLKQKKTKCEIQRSKNSVVDGNNVIG